MTRIEIEKEGSHSHCTEVFGGVPEAYLGKKVRLLQSFYKVGEDKDLREVLQCELYSGKRRIVNQVMIKRR